MKLVNDLSKIDELLKEETGFVYILSKQDLNALESMQKTHTALIKGQILKDQKVFEEARQNSCNHRKGGYAEYIHGKGYTGRIGLGSSSNDYAVIKHTFHWGDTWIRCLRCGKWWKPGDKDYQEALLFPTTNQTSTAIQLETDPISLARVREATRGT